MGEDTAHSRLGASSMYRWSRCPGSVRLSQGIPKTTSSYAEEGTRAHEIAARWLTTHEPPENYCADEEMLDAITIYYQAIAEDIVAHGGEVERFIENKFDLEEVYPGCFGTDDCALYFRRHKKLIVYDLKYGQGIAVEVQEGGKANPQLQYYGLGALISTGYPCEVVELVIVQPRCPHPDGPVRRTTLSAMEILDFCADLIDYAKATEVPDAPLVPGDHCRFCPAAGVCPALHGKAQLVAKEQFSPALSYDPLKLATALSQIPMAEAWIKNVREFAYQEAMHGRVPPGYKLVPKRATRKWQEHVTAEMLSEAVQLSEDFLVDVSLKSPAQVEKNLTKAGKELVAPLIAAVSSGMSLVPETDRREALRKDAKSEFSAVIDVPGGTSVTAL